MSKARTSGLLRIQLDKERHLKLSLNGMIAFEEETGLSLLEKQSFERLSAKQLRALLWACLIHEDPELTQEQVGAMIDTNNVQAVINSIAEVWETSIPTDEAYGIDPLKDGEGG